MFKNKFINLWLPIFIILLSVTLVYHKHFDNEFHFDDNHTIQNNIYIQDLKNFKKYFSDATTFSETFACKLNSVLVTTLFII